MPKKAPKKKSTSKVVVEEPVAPVAPVEPVAPPVDDTAAEIQLFDYSEEIASLKTDLKTALDLVRSIMTNVTALEKRSARDTKVVAKKMRGKVRRTGDNKIISGFSKPGPVSEELRAFLKIGKDDLIARTQVTKAITKYCQEHDLQNKKDRRIIMADKTLQKLLRVSKTDELTYFNLQKYMKVHFPNKEGVYPTL
jgi:chromatin remodeling complex protein RSC6